MAMTRLLARLRYWAFRRAAGWCGLMVGIAVTRSDDDLIPILIVLRRRHDEAATHVMNRLAAAAGMIDGQELPRSPARTH